MADPNALQSFFEQINTNLSADQNGEGPDLSLEGKTGAERGQLLLEQKPDNSAVQKLALEEFRTDEERAEINAQNIQTLRLVDGILNNSEDGEVKGTGALSNLLFAPDAASRNMFGNLSSGVTSALDEESASNVADRAQLIAEDFRKAYQTLKGGGQITEFESKTVANALTKLSQRNLTDKLLVEELNRIKSIVSHSIQREALGIITDASGKEFQTDKDGNRQRVRTYITDNKMKVVPAEENSVMFSNYLDKDQQVNLYNQLPSGATGYIQNEDGSLSKFVKE